MFLSFLYQVIRTLGKMDTRLGSVCFVFRFSLVCHSLSLASVSMDLLYIRHTCCESKENPFLLATRVSALHILFCTFDFFPMLFIYRANYLFTHLTHFVHFIFGPATYEDALLFLLLFYLCYCEFRLRLLER